jgi:hypothetical protein
MAGHRQMQSAKCKMQNAKCKIGEEANASLGRGAFALGWAALVVGATCLAGGAWLGWRRGDDFAYASHSYMVNYSFFLSISLGALFWVAVDHACRAGWCVNVRRLAEIIAANVGCLALLALPIVVPVLLDYHGLFPWNDRAAAADDPALRAKAAYLAPGFFGIRSAVYLAVWWGLARFYLGRSLEQDRSGDPNLTLRMERWSPAALLLYAFTVTFASFDWLMSLSPRWFSTIFGVYFYSGAAVAFFAAIILLAMLLQRSGRLTGSITVEHYHDLGKLMFAFVVFWGYMAFSQYLLIWYANIPEETEWYSARQAGPWAWVSVGLLFAGLLIPFAGLLSRHAKRWKPSLAFWAAWLLAAHWLDLYWIVMPNLGGHIAGHAGATPWPPGPIDLSLFLGLGGVYLAGLVHVAGRRPLLPTADPRRGESLAFENS